MFFRFGIGLMLAKAPRLRGWCGLHPSHRPVGEQNLAGTKSIEHVLGAFAVLGLAFAELERNRQAFGVDERMDFGGQAATRATHATGSLIFFLVFAAC
jgi:hypothetical protein